jgi:hypothetical protein
MSQVSMTEEAARSLNLKLQVLEVLRRDEVGDVIRAARSSQAEAREHVVVGGLMSYGPNFPDLFRRAAGTATLH